jgi:Universal stress protein family
VLQEHVARQIVEEALLWECQGIVLGSRRLHGIARLSGRGVRERIFRLSSLPVLVAPAAETNGIFWPTRFRPNREHTEAVATPRERAVGDRGFPSGPVLGEAMNTAAIRANAPTLLIYGASLLVVLWCVVDAVRRPSNELAPPRRRRG